MKKSPERSFLRLSVLLIILVAMLVTGHVLAWHSWSMNTSGAGYVGNVVAVASPATDQTELVNITYDIVGATPPMTVSLEISSDGGTTFTVPTTSAAGDIGSVATVGAGKKITWDPFVDWPMGFSSRMVFRVVLFDSSVAAAPTGMTTVTSGSFQMGESLKGDGIEKEDVTGTLVKDEVPVHLVTITQPHYMDTGLVSKSTWDTVYNWAIKNGYNFSSANPGMGKALQHPVQSVNWYDSLKWCNARSEKEGLTPCYYTNDDKVYRQGQLDLFSGNIRSTMGTPLDKTKYTGYRLPTEAEWEWAARGGQSGKRFPWSKDDLIKSTLANYHSNLSPSYDSGPVGFNPTFGVGALPYTSPSNAFPANGYGLNDMAGNVKQWCFDYYFAYYYTQGARIDPVSNSYWSVNGEIKYCHTVRGGSWNTPATQCRVSARNFQAPGDKTNEVGFGTLRNVTIGNTSTAWSNPITVDTRSYSLLTTSVYPPDSGTTTGDGYYPDTSNTIYPTVTITAIGNALWTFTNWSDWNPANPDDPAITDNPRSVTVPYGGVNYEAVFVHPIDLWRADNFSMAELADPAISGDSATPENDGITNLLKYAFNLTRGNPDRTKLPSSASENGYLTLTYVVNNAATDLSYVVEYSDNMNDWYPLVGYTSATIAQDAATKTIKVTDSVLLSSVPKRFVHVQVIRRK